MVCSDCRAYAVLILLLEHNLWHDSKVLIEVTVCATQTIFGISHVVQSELR